MWFSSGLRLSFRDCQKYFQGRGDSFLSGLKYSFIIRLHFCPKNTTLLSTQGIFMQINHHVLFLEGFNIFLFRFSSGLRLSFRDCLNYFEGREDSFLSGLKYSFIIRLHFRPKNTTLLLTQGIFMQINHHVLFLEGFNIFSLWFSSDLRLSCRDCQKYLEGRGASIFWV